MQRKIKKMQFGILIWLLQVSVAYCQYDTRLSTLEKKYDMRGSDKMIQGLSTISYPKLNKADKAYYLYLKANALLYLEKKDIAYKEFITSKKIYLQIDSIEKAMDINLKMSYLLISLKKNTLEYENYIAAALTYYNSSTNIHNKIKGLISIASLKINETHAKESILLFKQAMKLSEPLDNDDQKSSINNNLAVLYNERMLMPDSALYYLKKDYAYSIKIKDNYAICVNLINQASSYSKKKDIKTAIHLLNQADSIPLKQDRLEMKFYINYYKNLYYKESNDYKKAILYLEKSNLYRDSLEGEKQNLAINELHTKYKTQEKELENLQLKTNIKNNRLLLYSIILVLIVLVTISILGYKNITKKKRIAEQDRLIKIQELEKVLKNQELNNIDLMLESQEKERQNIANELHDNLGSMLATLKLNFQNLKRQKEDLDLQENKLYDKTDALLEEAYQKVRNIAHLKNLGVIGNEGLLVAVYNMAEKMSVLEKLKINVIPFGLNERLDNTIEVTLFRMIQELCTNIIKHSQATEVNIYLTQGDNTEINIIIEDNGKGFDPKTIVLKSGIGLKNMEKKVEQMGGTFTIDSIPTKGTSIIIDLPL
ncbi:sensor histidine kinase [Flavobacterium restrictum]|uniref:Oxygen sensor histidine kinase NreB n=2 Tax=Flavobacterium restrictum TaxID=2594428 RepID=A0A553E2H4_9FLAO|nr:sensor histidine kinase [Flavobacterium restrictum]